MARRRKKQDPVSALLQFLFLTVFLGAFYFTKSFFASAIVFIVCLCSFIVFWVVRMNAKAERLKKSGIAQIDSMYGIQLAPEFIRIFIKEIVGFSRETALIVLKAQSNTFAMPNHLQQSSGQHLTSKKCCMGML